ncbi:MAG: hypothetical protein IKT40_03220 [Bacilli bacterium]|nr:hypothetical protein [Bacilli bacterium]
MKKKKEFKVIEPPIDTIKIEAVPLNNVGADDIFEKEYQRKKRRERILDIIVGIVLPILVVLSWATLVITDAVEESKMRKDCVTYLVQTYNISDDYMYEVEEINNIKTSNKNIEYLCKVTIYNDDWHIEAIMSVNENDDDKRKINIEKILKEMKGDISD